MSQAACESFGSRLEKEFVRGRLLILTSRAFNFGLENFSS